MELKTIKDVINYWNVNHYTQEICINALTDILKNNYTVEHNAWCNLEMVLESIIENIKLGENRVIDAINVLEMLITDKEELAGIACILSGEYLTECHSDLVEILEYYEWNVPSVKNIFMDWYFKLKGITNYYEQALTSFRKYKLENTARALGAVLSGITLPYLFIAVLYLMNRSLLTSVNRIILTVILFVILFATAFATVIFSNKLKLTTLLRMSMGFKEYNL